MFAQTGQNAVFNATVPTPSPSFFDATQFGVANNDPCQRIFFTFTDTSFPSQGGTVDARGLAPVTGTSIFKCSVNPIPSGAKGRLLLGSGTYLALVPWVIQSNDFNVVGTGGSDTNGNNNTIIQACNSGQTGWVAVVFPSGRAVIEMGNSTHRKLLGRAKRLEPPVL